MPGPRVSVLRLLSQRYPDRTERELAALVMRGRVLIDGEPVTKAGARVSAAARVELRELPPYVSRGGEKLAAALEGWGLPVQGQVFLDAGASTGGFTDCLLRHGARIVHCVDVGVGQLSWRLRSDPRVRLHEGVNVMSLRPSSLDPRPQAAVADLSFRSLRGAAARILDLTLEGWGIFLVKPQFELREPPPGFRGIVRGDAERLAILSSLVEELWEEGVRTRRVMASPVAGRRGNRELLALLSNRPGGSREEAHAALEASVLRSDER